MLTEWPLDCWRHPGTMGFTNSGVDCFWTSALVAILHMPPLVQWLLIHVQEDCPVTVDCGECAACLLGYLCKKYWSAEKENGQKDLDRLAGELWRCCRRKFWSGPDKSQDDAAGFLTGFINYLINNFDIPGRYGNLEPLPSMLFDLRLRITIETTNFFRTCL